MVYRHGIRGRKGQFTAKPKAPMVPALNDQSLRGVMIDTLTPGIGKYAVTLAAEVNTVMYQVAMELEQWAKENAPWQDRTTDAREGLTAAFNPAGVQPSITIYHTVSYGVWLEICNGGQYAIIQPTIERFGPELMRKLQVMLL